MNQKHSDESVKHTPTDITATPRQGRRKLIQAGIAGAPVLLALKSTPVLAGNCKQPSGFSVSGNLSATHGKNCSSPFPSISKWQNTSPWPGGLTPDTPFKTAFGANALNQPDTFTLGAALAEGTISLNARAVAVLLGSFSFGPPGSDVVKDLWVKGVVQGSYATLGYKSEHTVWRRNEVEKYFDYLLGLNPGTP